MTPAQTKLLSPEQVAYIAGLIDGEGTITLTSEHRGESRRLVVSIANTEIELLSFVLEATGVGKITKKRVTKSQHTPSFAYRATSQQALSLLAQIGPYMHSYKARRAALALAHYTRLTPRNGKYSDGLARQRTEFESEFLSMRA